MTTTIKYQNYVIEPVYRNLTKAARNEIVILWLENGALSDVRKAIRRTNEVVYAVRNQQDEIVGVSTVYSGPHGEDSETYLHYRMFIRPQDRIPGLMREVTQTTRRFFDTSRAFRDEARGIIICAENPKLMRRGLRRLFERCGWDHHGKDHRGFDVWRFDFAS